MKKPNLKPLCQYAAEARAKKKREKLILDHTFVVDKIAKHVHRGMTHLDIEDLRQAGFVGLVEAADRYVAANGIFEHYAYFRIRGAMFDAHKRRAYRDDTHDSLEQTHLVHGSGPTPNVLPKYIVIDKGPLPDAIAAHREQSRMLHAAVDELEPDEKRVFLASLEGIPLIKTAENCMRSVAWTRAKLASARAQLGATVQMWGLGLDKAA